MTAAKSPTVHWKCLECHESGTVTETKTGTSGAHIEHMKSCGGGVMTSLKGWGK